jgi:hypothetical protein
VAAVPRPAPLDVGLVAAMPWLYLFARLLGTRRDTSLPRPIHSVVLCPVKNLVVEILPCAQLNAGGGVPIFCARV